MLSHIYVTWGCWNTSLAVSYVCQFTESAKTMIVCYCDYQHGYWSLCCCCCCCCTRWSIKTWHYVIDDNFAKCEPICTTFAPFRRELNFQQNPCNISHFILTLVSHYLGKFKRLICLKNRACEHHNPLKQESVTSENDDWFLI